jgi:hypothetical protein
MPTKKRKTPEPTLDTHSLDTPATQPDVFDAAIAAREAAPLSRPETPALAGEAVSPVAVTPADANRPAYQPDPFPALSIALGEGNDAPKMRLYRNRRMNQVAIQFDEKPEEPYRQRLRDEGYTWRGAEGVWTKQLGEQRASGQLAAERLVEELANTIRQDKGLAPAGRSAGE